MDPHKRDMRPHEATLITNQVILLLHQAFQLYLHHPIDSSLTYAAKWAAWKNKLTSNPLLTKDNPNQEEPHSVTFSVISRLLHLVTMDLHSHRRPTLPLLRQWLRRVDELKAFWYFEDRKIVLDSFPCFPDRAQTQAEWIGQNSTFQERQHQDQLNLRKNQRQFFHSFQDPDESVINWYQRLRVLFAQAFPCLVAKGSYLLLDQFVLGLHSVPLAQYVWYSTPFDVEQAYTLAAPWDQSLTGRIIILQKMPAHRERNTKDALTLGNLNFKGLKWLPFDQNPFYIPAFAYKPPSESIAVSCPPHENLAQAPLVPLSPSASSSTLPNLTRETSLLQRTSAVDNTLPDSHSTSLDLSAISTQEETPSPQTDASSLGNKTQHPRMHPYPLRSRRP